MKRYECRFVAALVFGLLPCLVMCYPRTIASPDRAPYSPTTGRRGSHQPNDINSQMQCTEFKSSFLRTQCGNHGYLTVNRNRVLVQTSGLSENHPQAEFVIESCSRPQPEFWFSSRPSFSESLVRYRHSSSNKYICFKRNGAVRAVSAKHVEGRGRLCLFRQVAVETMSPYEDKTYHRIQSAYNPKWHLGFQHKTVPLAGRGPHIRGALSRSWTRRRFNVHKCDFKFYSGDHRPLIDITYSGLDALVREHHNPLTPSPYPHSKAAINSESDITSNDIGDVSKDDTEKVSDTKISKGYKKQLLQQQVLKRMHHQRKIRHPRHKRPRPSRAEKNGLKALKRKQPMATMSKTQNFV